MYLNECAAEEKRETAAMTLVTADTITVLMHLVLYALNSEPSIFWSMFKIRFHLLSVSFDARL
jgi:hypothetical protein